jgi:hypothetical protein
VTTDGIDIPAGVDLPDGHVQIDISVAAHNVPSADMGPRSSPDVLVDKRKHLMNALHMCRNCHEIVDRAPAIFTCDMLANMKKAHNGEVFNKNFCGLATI